MTAPQTGDPMRDLRTCNPIATGALKQGARPPYVLESADLVKPGSLVKRAGDRPVIRLLDGTGWTVREMPLVGTGWRWDPVYPGPVTVLAEGLTEAECRHLSSLSAQDAIAWCEQRAKPRPQPGDVVPWAEMEDGALYFDTPCMVPFVGRHNGRWHWLSHEGEGAIISSGYLCEGRGSTNPRPTLTNSDKATLVARNLGSDPEAWRKAMREWTANGNKPSKPADPLYEAFDVVRTGTGYTFTSKATPESERREVKRIVDPLRQPGVLSSGGCSEATPERVVALALERIEADRREIERLRAANVEARRALETPGRQGLRARLAKAEAALVAQRDAARKAEAMRAVAEHQSGQLRAALHRCNEADETMIALARDAASRAGFTSFGGTIPAVKAVIGALAERASCAGSLQATCDKLQIEHARSVDALTAQRDEARRALADEKVKTGRLDRAAVGGLAAQDALIRAANACGVRSGTWAELATGIVAHLSEVKDDARKYRNARSTLGVPESSSIVAHVGAIRDRADADAAEVRKYKERAEKAERNLRAAAELLAA